jgi:hypothetical protein
MIGSRMPVSTMPEDWDVGEEYHCIRILGKGGYGQVCEAV